MSGFLVKRLGRVEEHLVRLCTTPQCFFLKLDILLIFGGPPSSSHSRSFWGLGT